MLFPVVDFLAQHGVRHGWVLSGSQHAIDHKWLSDMRPPMTKASGREMRSVNSNGPKFKRSRARSGGMDISLLELESNGNVMCLPALLQRYLVRTVAHRQDESFSMDTMDLTRGRCNSGM